MTRGMGDDEFEGRVVTPDEIVADRAVNAEFIQQLNLDTNQEQVELPDSGYRVQRSAGTCPYCKGPAEFFIDSRDWSPDFDCDECSGRNRMLDVDWPRGCREPVLRKHQTNPEAP